MRATCDERHPSVQLRVTFGGLFKYRHEQKKRRQGYLRHREDLPYAGVLIAQHAADPPRALPPLVVRLICASCPILAPPSYSEVSSKGTRAIWYTTRGGIIRVHTSRCRRGGPLQGL